MITIQREKCNQVLGEIMPLLHEHWKEVGIFRDKIKLNPNFKQYEIMEENNMLYIATARREGKLIGYSVFFMVDNIHYSGNIFALNDIIFILPEYRKGSLALKIIDFTEAALKKMNVSVISYHVKVVHDFSPILERKGFEWLEKGLSKFIGESK